MAIGIPVTQRLVVVYTVAAGMAGAAGSLLAQTTGFASLEVFGIERSAEDRARGKVIADILCHGEALLAPCCDDADVERALLPFRSARLVEVRQGRLLLAPDARPYARAIAAAFDRYRTQPQDRFSSAI
ncbi:MAG: hypothetical protein ACK4MT_05610, partial [Thermaurantiacus tibetensis]